MRKRIRKILITGGAGFIGSAFTRLAACQGYKLVVVDKLTYAGDLQRLAEVKHKISFYKHDISNCKLMRKLFLKERPQVVVNFAAETHVDRSINDCAPFVAANVTGVQVLLDTALGYGLEKFVHISTDEVYGDIRQGAFTEASCLRPSSPYAASKASADLFIKAFERTFAFPAIIIRPCNNYGPWQYPEKLIPLSISKVLRKKKIPLYAHGRNSREWLYVDDCAQGIMQVIDKGRLGEIYNLGSGQEKQNIEVARDILKLFGLSDKSIQFVKDRPGHDWRYRMSSRKLLIETGFKPTVHFNAGIRMTVDWCARHKNWMLSKTPGA